MQISRNHVVTLIYQVHDQEGNLVDAGTEPLVYLHGGYDGLFDAMETALQGKASGDTFRVKLTAEEAFGDYDDSLVSVEPRNLFPPNIQIGTQVESDGEDGEPQLYTITAIDKNTVVVDGNHPLAGLDLVFSGSIAEVRPATAAEIAAGQPA